jgi:quercetin dioxygenase-like cupin family protein
MQVVRFGVGHRRPDGPPGTVGLQGQVIHADARGLISELAFARNARIEPHSNPNTTWFVVIEGGGWVAVGEERTRVAAGEAILWPPDIIHGAWTDYSEMRAIVVEFATADENARLLEGRARPVLEPTAEAVRAEGRLSPGDRGRDATTREGEPY